MSYREPEPHNDTKSSPAGLQMCSSRADTASLRLTCTNFPQAGIKKGCHKGEFLHRHLVWSQNIQVFQSNQEHLQLTLIFGPHLEDFFAFSCTFSLPDCVRSLFYNKIEHAHGKPLGGGGGVQKGLGD